MRREAFGADNDDRVVFVLGWGNKPEYANVAWLIDRLVKAGYRVDVFEIPPHISDWEAEWVDPVRSFVADLDSYRSLSHSTGGLISRYLDPGPVESRVYLSPWWGFHEDLQGPMLSVITALPIPWPVIPASFDKADLGDLATEEQVEGTPSRMAPTFLREARRAQRNMPPFDDDDIVFYTPSDPIVGVEAIETQAPAENRIRYEGGHELFCSSARDDHIDRLLAALDRGIDAL